MATPNDAKAKAATTYNAAADYYDNPANSFWERFGRATVERLQLPLGSRVLDVCCGSGASALPAAEMVGPQGFVLGIDLAENLLELARTKAVKRGLMNTKFRVGDLLDMHLSEIQFDAVICVLEFFYPQYAGGYSCALARGSSWKQARTNDLGTAFPRTGNDRILERGSRRETRSLQRV